MPDTPLASVADLEARLGRTLTGEEATRAAALLVDASAAARSYTGQQFIEDETTVRLKVSRGKVRLPQAPATGVTTVEDTDENPVTFTWLMGQTVEVSTQVPDGWAFEPYSQGLQVVDVTYSHGYETVPDDVIAVVCQIAGRALGATAESSGVQSETIRTYSYSLGGAAASGPVGMLAGERAILDRYRQPATQVYAH